GPSPCVEPPSWGGPPKRSRPKTAPSQQRPPRGERTVEFPLAIFIPHFRTPGDKRLKWRRFWHRERAVGWTSDKRNCYRCRDAPRLEEKAAGDRHPHPAQRDRDAADGIV